ncbi:hypothetical protein WN55_11096, partial [Dufourea novaeangliae]
VNVFRRSIAGPTLGRQDAVESYPDEEMPSLPTKRRSLPPSATTLSLNTLHRDIKEAFSRRCGSLRKKHQPAPEPAPLPIESTDVSILVTEPSPENIAPPPTRPALLRRQSAATVVHVLVHRESEEYRDAQPDDTT